MVVEVCFIETSHFHSYFSVRQISSDFHKTGFFFNHVKSKLNDEVTELENSDEVPIKIFAKSN